MKGEIDAGAEIANAQMIELEEWVASQGCPKTDV